MKSIVEKFRKAAREAVTTQEIFVSSIMRDFLASKLRLICKRFKVAMPALRVLYSEESGITAATSLGEMIINAGHKMFNGDDDMRLLKIAGVLLHELGHILFTNYTAWEVWERDIRRGIFYPRLPDVAPDLEDARSSLSELAKDRRFISGFVRIAHDLNNSLEDGRIENFILKFIRNARFMIRGLVRLRQETYAECPSFEEIVARVDKGEWGPIAAIMQLALHYARFREIKGNLDETHPLGKLIVQMMPEIEVYLEAKEAVVCYDAFNKMLVMMANIIIDSFNKAKEQAQQQSQGQQSQQGGQSGQSNGQQSQSQGQGQSQPGGSPSSGGDAESGESGSSNSSAGEGSGQSDSGEGSSASGDAESESGSEENGSGGDSDSDGDSEAEGKSSEGDSSSDDSGSSDSSAESELDEQSIADAIEQMVKEMLEKIEGKTIDNSERMSAQAKGSDRGSVSRALTGIAKGEGGKVGTPNAANAADGTGEISHEESSLESNVNLTLDDIARRIADENAEKALSSALKSEYGSIAKDVQDYNDIHKYCDITMFHYSEVSEEDKRRYDEIAREISPLVKKAVKGSNFYEKDSHVVIEDNLFSGRTLHAEKSYRKDGKLFSKRYDKEDPPMVALAVRIDSSGSMSGERIKAAKRTCIFLYEYALAMEKKYSIKIPLYIYGDCVWREAPGVNMYVFADDKFRTPNEKYRIMKLAAGGCNRDGLPIRMAVKRLEQEHPYASKVVFNITDGQPNDREYGGEPAFDDLRDITRHCEKRRIALAACAIGDDSDMIEEIYGSNHFLNISSLDDLPIRLVKILKKLLK